MKHTILVTGASSGIGLLVANKLHQEGYQVIGTSRSPEKHQAKLPFKLLALDLNDDRSIASLGKQLFSEIKTLDVLINNAGYLVNGLAEETPVELGKQQFETNFWGTIKLTNELLPYFRRQKHGKIITLGSLLGLVGLPYVAYYAASKHALEGYFKSLRFELNQFNIKVVMLEPMSFKTSIGESGTVAEGNIRDYDLFRKKITSYTKSTFDKAPEPAPVVAALLKAVKEKNPTFSYPVGKGSSIILLLQHFAYKIFEKSILKSINASK
ncbi:SDR family NAD(P)-dependent oxidoreductase [Mucilaginibacter gossypii]|uniref:SDR family NAD(P)-dependent oxidoreductase n=1 Tax=Mucilaginibacter gossypii TaxID=551996 RepID=UPI000DCE2416|nr:MULTISPECIES: SDR family NAD(P)-dependent oxidoreductase [Mucilaginibacter]QTE39795.1 SDR family NAD(P)-dependent oxidoreductase [Mucilaginibacter gossypii]RAV54173.1 short-chain dehydrogenase/reductase [Mucilaginibacter rubeus]